MVLTKELKGGIRALYKNPMVTALAVASLALAIAGNTVVFSLVSSWLWHSWNYPEPEGIVFVWQSKPDEFLGQTPASLANFADWKERSTTLEQWSAYRAAPFTLTGDDSVEAVIGGEVSAELFRVLGAEATYGRLFTEDDELPGRDHVVVLSHEFWQEQHGADPSLVGKSLKLNGESYSVVGILPASFEFIFGPGDFYKPLVLKGENLPRSRKELIVVARLPAGRLMEDAEREMQAIAKDLRQEHPVENRDYTAKLLTLPDQFPGELNERLFLFLQLLMVFVLAIACINVANLLLARGQRRQKELALRRALGADSASIARLLLSESLVLAGAGGLVGIGLSFLGIRFLFAFFRTQLPQSMVPTLDLQVLGLTLLVTVAAGVAFGLAPVLQSGSPSLTASLGEGRSGAAGIKRKWLSKALVVAETAFALIMLCGAGLLVHSFLKIQNAEPGFNQDRLLTFGLSLPENRYQDDAEKLRTVEQLENRLAAIPGVTSVTAASSLPRTFLTPSESFTIEGRGDSPEDSASVTWVAVGEGYLETLAVPLLRGRSLERGDRDGAARVVLINRAMAQSYWPDQEPLGEAIQFQDQRWEIVGVIPDIQQNLLVGSDVGAQPILYLPAGQSPMANPAFLLRTGPEPETIIPAVREALLKLDPELQPLQMQSFESLMNRFFAGMQAINRLLVIIGFVALLLSAVGIYGVIAYSIAQRTQEIGIRMALGARRRDVLRQITWEGLVLALLGFAFGGVGVVAVVLGMTAMLQGFSTVSPMVAVGVAGLLFLVATAASVLPARRAASLDPLIALRTE